MANLACIGFVGTNYNNVVNKGDITRLPVLVGQCANAAEQGIKCNRTINQAANQVLNVASGNKVFNGFAKSVNFVRKNINPLIIASSGAKVVFADKEERTKTLITETGTLTGMFLAEGKMKKHLDKLLDKLPISPKWRPVVHGLIFISGSLTGSTIGNKIGKKVAQFWDTPLGKEERITKEQSQQQHKAYEPMKLNA